MQKHLIPYYAILMGFLLAWNDAQSSPPILLCILFFGMLILPFMFNRKKNTNALICIFMLFSLVSSNHYAPSFMPATSLYLLLAAVVMKILTAGKITKTPQIPPIIIIISLVIGAVELFCKHSNFNILFNYLFLIVFLLSIDEEGKDLSHWFSLSLILVSFVIAIDFAVYGARFVNEVSTDKGIFDRMGWSDPNYFSSVAGMGLVAAGIELANGNAKKNKLYRAFVIVTILLAVLMMLRVASRGAILALCISAIVLTLTSNVKTGTRVALIISVVAFLILLYNFHLFDFLVSRVISDEGDGGGRIGIWTIRLNTFFREADWYNYLFGLGYIDAQRLGTGTNLGFHNDYIGFLVKYGFVGLALFLTMLFYPVYKSSRQTRSITLSAIAYIMVISVSLEPLSGGYFESFFYWAYCLLLARSKPNAVESVEQL